MSLGRIPPKQRTGHELIHHDGKAIGASLLNYWRWYASDLIGNTKRGDFAEFLVALAVEDISLTNGAREGWEPYDVMSDGGAKIEVKSSAYVQSWNQDRESTPSFDIGRKFTWDADTDEFTDIKARAADVYVFCLLNHRGDAPVWEIDPLNVSQWDFYVVPTASLEEELPDRKRISLAGIESLGVAKIPYEELKQCVERAYRCNLN